MSKTYEIKGIILLIGLVLLLLIWVVRLSIYGYYLLAALVSGIATGRVRLTRRSLADGWHNFRKATLTNKLTLWLAVLPFLLLFGALVVAVLTADG